MPHTSLAYRDMFGQFYTHANYDKFKKDLCKRLAHKDPYQSHNIKPTTTGEK